LSLRQTAVKCIAGFVPRCRRSRAANRTGRKRHGAYRVPDGFGSAFADPHSGAILARRRDELHRGGRLRDYNTPATIARSASVVTIYQVPRARKSGSPVFARSDSPPTQMMIS
jgi:hypothetical protein